MRINKFFTDLGICSRREADRYIEAGRIKINDRLAKLGDQVSESDQVYFDGQLLSYNPPKVYIMFNKPRGVTCTTDPNINRNIISEVRHPLRVFMIGRLDKDSTGLIFLTNDGDIVNKILRAQFGHEKEYVVEINCPVTENFVSKMSAGVHIGDCKTKPCKVKKLSGNTFSIILTEGKNRQIRRMCEANGAVVKNLHRVRIMNVQLGDLAPGQWRDIPASELQKIKDSVAQTADETDATISELLE